VIRGDRGSVSADDRRRLRGYYASNIETATPTEHRHGNAFAAPDAEASVCGTSFLSAWPVGILRLFKQP